MTPVRKKSRREVAPRPAGPPVWPYPVAIAVMGATIYAFVRSPPPSKALSAASSTASASTPPEIPTPAEPELEPMPTVLPINPTPPVSAVVPPPKVTKSGLKCPPNSEPAEELDSSGNPVSAGCSTLKLVIGGYKKIGTWWTTNSDGQTFGGNYDQDGLRDGTWSIFNADGHKAQEMHYLRGTLDGWYTEWDEKGRKTLERFYTRDQLDGPLTVYFVDGSMRKRLFRDGVLVSEEMVDPDGTVHPVGLMNH